MTQECVYADGGLDPGRRPDGGGGDRCDVRGVSAFDPGTGQLHGERPDDHAGRAGADGSARFRDPRQIPPQEFRGCGGGCSGRIGAEAADSVFRPADRPEADGGIVRARG